jgi:uncharacterized protein YaaQ
MVDSIQVEIDDDYGYPSQDWLEENGYHVVRVNQTNEFVRSGTTNFIIGSDNGDYFTYKTSYISDGVIVWHTSGSVVKATRCYRKVKMVESYYFEDNL